MTDVSMLGFIVLLVWVIWTLAISYFQLRPEQQAA